MAAQSFVVLNVLGIFLAGVFGSHQVNLQRPSPGSADVPPAGPEVRCRCAGYPNRTLCFWTEPPGQFGATRYIATYRERNDRSVIQPCHLVPPGSSSSALKSSSSSSSSPEKLWLCLLDHLKLYTDYVVNVTSVSPLGSSTQLTSFMVEDIVKPDPPTELRVSQGGVRSLLVEWSPPPTWSNLDVFPLKYRVRYSRAHRPNHHVLLGPFESTQVELPGVAQGRTYLFQVCAMELLGLGQCSTWSPPVEVLIPRKH